MSLVTLRNGHLTVTISTLGAELQSILDKSGAERLWQGDPAFWTGRAPILFPMAGGLKEDCYILDGQRYEMPKHGHVRKLEWRAETASDVSATFLTTEKHPGFPFDYELRARYTLEGSALRVEYIVDNKGDRAFYYGLGAHEAYAAPEGIEAYEIVFDQEERLENYVLEGNLIRREPVVLAEHASTLPLKYAYFTVDALVFPALKSRSVTLQSRLHGRTVQVAYPGHDVLMLWTKPGAGYICIEPWLNAPDFVDHDLQIANKPGCVRLAPGESRTHVHTIAIG